jgi:hypothetical protein
MPEIVIFTNANGPLTKRIWLENGELKKDGSACNLVAGTAKRAWPNDPDEFANTITDLDLPQAIALGELRKDLDDTVRVVTRQKLGNTARCNLISRTRNFIDYFKPGRGFALIDFDDRGITPEIAEKIDDMGGFEEMLKEIVPALNYAAYVIRFSTSAGLYRSDTGEKIKGSNGVHLYPCVKNVADIQRFLKAIHQRLWLAGLGWYYVDVSGKLLERSPVDTSVWCPERLIYEAPPKLEPPLAQDKQLRGARIHDGRGEWIDTEKACPSLSSEEEAELKELQERTRGALAETSAIVRQEYISTRSEELATRANIPIHVARRAIEKQCNGILTPSIVLPFDDRELEGKTVADVFANPDMFVDETLADPIDPKYGTSFIVRGKAKILRRPDGTLFVKSFAHGGAAYSLVEDEPQEPSQNGKPDDPKGTLANMNLIYATVSVGGKFRVMTSLPHTQYPLQRVAEFSTKEDFLNQVVTPKISIQKKDRKGVDTIVSIGRGKWWIENPEHRKFDGIDFLPGGLEEIITTDLRVANRIIRKINMWAGFSVKPAKGDCTLYLNHLRENVCGNNAELYSYTINWMAHGVQRPERPGRTSLTMRGEPGAGKGVMAKEYGKIFGRHFLHVSQREHLTGNFNAHSAEALITFADEALFFGNARDADIIKALVSEETKLLERKGIDAIQIPNYARLIFATNHDRVLRIELHDRRYCAYHVQLPSDMRGSAGADKRIAYFSSIVKQMESGGRAALLYMLLELDISKFNPEAIPETPELEHQKLLSAPPEVQAIIAIADIGLLPGALITRPFIARAHVDNDRVGLFDYMKRNGGRALEKASDNVVADILKKWGFKKKKLPDGNAWEAPDLHILRDKLAVQYQAIDWDDEITAWGTPPSADAE